jgi:DNA (cytosine-5)-methyltransferase 1
MAGRKVIRALDLFCGGGGSSIGARMAGVLPVAGLDHWPIATAAYEANFRAKTWCSKIEDVEPAHVEKAIGPIDLLLASPECTNHSVARGKAPESERSRRTAFEVARFARKLKPRWLVVENVTSMRQWAAFDEWWQELEAIGYKLRAVPLRSEFFGVPQSRRRLFVVGDLQMEPTTPEEPESCRKATIGEVIDRLKKNGHDWDAGHLHSRKRAKPTLARINRAFAELGRKTPFLVVYYGSDAAGGWQSIDRPLRTITTLDRFALVAPNGSGHTMRMLQPLELAAAMGFPSTYKFPPSTRREKIRLVGNAVCPPVMKAVIKSLVVAK